MDDNPPPAVLAGFERFEPPQRMRVDDCKKVLVELFVRFIGYDPAVYAGSHAVPNLILSHF